jgi:hypothetical protein
VVSESMGIGVVQPQNTAEWEAAYMRFEKILG